jgi:transposase
MAGGRPTDFKDEYCELLVQHMKEGYSFESFAGLVGVTRKTIYNWLEIPEFLHAKERGFEVSRLTWEKIGKTITVHGEGNATAFIFNMKNRFREDWNDKKEIEHSGEVKKTVIIDWPDGE